MKRKVRNLFGWGLAASIGLFIVNTMGFIDTVTGSAMGCGKEWPLCDGSFIPSVWDRATTIEYTHRLIAFLVILTLVTFAVLSWIHYRGWKEVRTLIGITVLAVLAEAGLGASSVLVDNPTWILAFHMGIAFTAFASCVLLTIVVGLIEKQRKKKKPGKLRGVSLPGFCARAWITIIYVFLAIYYGAFVTHSGYGGLFRGWPIPSETYLEAGIGLWIDFGHRLVALGLFILVFSLFRRAYRMRWVRRDLFIGSLCALSLTVLQIFSGAYLILSNISVPAFLSHVSLASLLFVSVAYLAMQTLPEGQVNTRETRQTVESQTERNSHGMFPKTYY